MRLNLFGKEIRARENYCACNNATCAQRVESSYINLYVQMTDICNARCDFCVAKNNPHNEFDAARFAELVDEIIDKSSLRKISFTGGEPTVKAEILNWCAAYIKHVSPDTKIVVNTNGSRLGKIAANLFNSIALSRHHYDDEFNAGVFKTVVPSAHALKALPDNVKSRLHLSCNLIRGGIDSSDEVVAYLNHAANIGVTDVGFVSLMDIGGASSEKRVTIDDSGILEDSRFFRTLSWNDEDSCKCYNLSYFADNGEVVRFYVRQVIKSNGNANLSTLVFDGYNLRRGFNTEIIW